MVDAFGAKAAYPQEQPARLSRFRHWIVELDGYAVRIFDEELMQPKVGYSSLARLGPHLEQASSHIGEAGRKERNVVKGAGASDIKLAFDAEVISGRRRIVRIDADDMNDRLVALVKPDTRKLEWRSPPLPQSKRVDVESTRLA